MSRALRATLQAVVAASLLLAASPAPAEPDPDERIRVLVAFRGLPGNAERAWVESLAAGVRHELPEVSTLALEIPRRELTALRRDPRVALVEEDLERHILQSGAELVPALDNGLYGLVSTRATAAHARGLVGRGGIVCIGDTGIDASHPDIAPNYLGGVDSVDDDDDPDTGNRSGAPSHGTMVAAIAAAALNGTGVRGVAYGAGIVHARVLPDSGSGPESDIMAGVRRLVDERGCRVVNLSLGSTEPSVIEERFYHEMADRGVLVVAAAGNDGTSGLEFPGGYSSVLAIGSVGNRNAHSDFSNTGLGLALSAPGENTLSAVPRGTGSEASVRARGSYRGEAMEFASRTSGASGTLVDCGNGNSPAQFPASVRGQVALIQRGVEHFSVKVQNAMNAGAVAAVIYNNVAGSFNGTLENATAAGGEAWIPTISVTDSAGRGLLKETGARATVVNSASDWASGSGTSFAAPHVSGAAALVLAINPALDRDQLVEILERSATPLGGGFNATFGHGLLNVEAAARQAAGGAAPAGGPCKSGPNVLCLLKNRFRVEVAWRNQFDGSSGPGKALPQSEVSGFFSFGDPSNLELLVKMLDFGGVIKLFYGELTNLGFTLTVTDTRTGETKTYRNTTGDCGAIDQDAFASAQPAAGASVALAPLHLAAPASSCRTGGGTLCLLKGRFEVQVDWSNPGNGTSGHGGAVGISELTGAFYFTDRTNLELLTKMIDFGDRVACFYGTLSDLEYTITVTDRSTGAQRTYHNAPGNFCGGLADPAF
jgi:subtilisin family serine protease